MSTMYEALKKAEAEHKKTVNIERKITLNLDPEPGSGMPKYINAPVLLTAVIVVFAFVLFQFRSLIHFPQKQAAILTAAAPQAAVQTAAPQRAPGTYELDGIIDAGENSMAIVNGKLLKPGGTIDALVLQKVSSKEADLLNTKNNSMVILKIE